ncbi:hypothetical protein LTR85_001380 [Meristemomyces frigidus]|nr:hypothetical protein LTR85_001380 [Meristemomyces frigidus]
MPDPLSITTGVLTLIGTCGNVGWQLKQFHGAAKIVDTTIEALLADVESITKVLDALQETVRVTRSSTLQETGHIGNHWRNLSKSIADGQNVLEHLQSLLERVGKTTTRLNKPRMQLRLYLAEDELSMLRQRMQAYRDTVQLSLTTVILWHQIAEKQSSDDILPSLRDVDVEIRRLAELFTRRIENLQVSAPDEAKEQDLQVAINLRDCIHSAATVVSSASTVLGVELCDRSTVRAASEYASCFPPVSGLAMQRWMDSRTEYSYVDVEDTSFRRSSGLHGGLESDSESDTELEADIIRSLLKRGQDAFDAGKLGAAEKTLRNCASRAETLDNRRGLRSSSASSRKLAAQVLLRIFISQCRWDDAQSNLVKEVSAHGKTNNTESRHDLEMLVDVLLQKGDFQSAHRYARQLLKAYRRLQGCETRHIIKTLCLLASISRQEGKADEEEAYTAMLSDMDQEADVQDPRCALLGTGGSRPESVERDSRITTPALSRPAVSDQNDEPIGTGTGEQEWRLTPSVATPRMIATDSGDLGHPDVRQEEDNATVATSPPGSRPASQHSTPKLRLRVDVNCGEDCPPEVPQMGFSLQEPWLGSAADRDESARAVAKETTITNVTDPNLTVSALASGALPVDLVGDPSDGGTTASKAPGPLGQYHTANLAVTSQTLRGAITLDIPQSDQGFVVEDQPTRGDLDSPGTLSMPALNDTMRLPRTPSPSSVSGSCLSPIFDGASDGLSRRSTATLLTMQTSTDDAESVAGKAEPVPKIVYGQVRHQHPKFANAEEHIAQSITITSLHRSAISYLELPPLEQGTTAPYTTSPLAEWVANDWPLASNTSTSGSNYAAEDPTPPEIESTAVTEQRNSTADDISLSETNSNVNIVAKTTRGQQDGLSPPLDASREKYGDIAAFAPTMISRVMSVDGPRRLPLRAAGNSTASPLSPSVEPVAIRRNLCCIGDGGCGKTGLLQRAGRNCFEEGTGPTVVDTYRIRVEVQVPSHGWVDLILSDTGETSEASRIHSLKACQVVLIAFDLTDAASLENVQMKWSLEAAKYAPEVPMLLVGCRSDRIDKISEAESRVQEVCHDIGAIAYYDTSALTGKGVDELMREAACVAQAQVTGHTRRHVRNRSRFRHS